ncbi:MAG: hypothetical protein CMK83_08465 [Pseudomonadales bacterium]|jgi:hypothetical protein|uniref:hypothetical protein n=1 Tax=unclassified Ketobacter TaxID=2639109 RepID=UPI000C926317|nr:MULTISPECIES: hypothetical protein [unclassified Ketobacter]MAA60943.1 hypothetical protein [Pseudomonadales bacterium]MEC8812067.1 hypothetical protein [Pseudomonadota bacterium]TNC91061.1 MAG: hypothetical protein CSH49_00205 [Alcanivorax sp.]HAG93777.1 hypothetical protein [Gammaproteobacteria bacterium]MAQ24243.1 hypothetical protein [Pseudomonadales bacterium]|tara:strand:- start:1047 stop:1250 length:204 start_codon:yes stop_codon:yes gene_type:complete
MQLIAILGVLVAVNLGIVYVGSEAVDESQPQVEGVVEVEAVDATEAPAAEQSMDAQPAQESSDAAAQ